MEKIAETIQNRTQRVKKQKGIHSYSHVVVKEICDYFGEKKFGLWLGVAKRIGAGELRAKFTYVKEKGIRSPQYLMACCRKHGN